MAIVPCLPCRAKTGMGEITYPRITLVLRARVQAYQRQASGACLRIVQGAGATACKAGRGGAELQVHAVAGCSVHHFIPAISLSKIIIPDTSSGRYPPLRGHGQVSKGVDQQIWCAEIL